MPRIAEIFCFVASDGPEDEGIVAMNATHEPLGQTMMPLVGADMARVKSLKAPAQSIADATGKTIRVLRFSRRTQIDVIYPRWGRK